MSKPIAVIEIAKPATLPASTRKLITGVNIAGVLTSVIPDTTGLIRPRSIVMTHESARACIGAPTNAKAYISGLAYLTLAHAYGQGAIEDLAKGAPRHSIEALTKVCSYFKRGAGGVTLPALVDAMDATIQHMLTLATAKRAKMADAKGNDEKPAIEGESNRITDEPTIDASGRISAHSLAFGHEAHEDSILAADAARIQASFRVQEARNEAQREAQREAAKEIDIPAMFAGLAINRPDYAVEQLRAAAAILGYRLTRIPVGKTA